jgi:hypothetical protein
MAKKQDKKKARSSSPASSGGGGELLPVEIEQVRTLIAEQHSKAALQLAKDLFKRCSTAEAEGLLVDAYQARIESLLGLGMAVEAKTLLSIVRERFPAALSRLAKAEQEISALSGRLDQVVAPLADPALALEDRERIETFIRQRVHDLPALAAVSSLPAEHSLRVAAAALAAAFQAVTKGPVEDEILALPEVSRRSPLASWKALIRAIASYHRHEEDECENWLRTIASDSLPARLIPVFTALRGEKLETPMSPAGQRLIDGAGDHSAGLSLALAAMEKALLGKKQKPILDAARSVAAASAHCDAQLRERLRQHISVRSILLDVPAFTVHAALGGVPRLDAYYFRLLARGLEEQKYPESRAEAAIVWEDFRLRAIKENWFAAGSLEDGILSLHVAQTIEELPDDVVEEMHEREVSYRKRNSAASEKTLSLPTDLYPRACLADPHSEAFQSWLRWAVKNETWQVADHVAEEWRKALPTEVQPLLHLMESAEKRSAFKKSLGYLEQAEKLDHLNPAVRRAKLRLLLATVLRHLRQRKTHLALSGITEIEALPEVRPGEIAALVAALRSCSAAVDGDKAACAAELKKLGQAQGIVVTHLLLVALQREAGFNTETKPPQVKISKDAALDLLTGTVRACLLGEWAGLPIVLPDEWSKTLIAALYLPNCPVDIAQMMLLGETALENLPELAYAVSSVGLAQGRANARFLFLRARALPPWAKLRCNGCMTAALELARRERNTELAGKILDCLNGIDSASRKGYGFMIEPEIASRSVSPELLGEILEEEKGLEQYPTYQGYQKPKYGPKVDSSLCDCPRCRAKRGELVDEDDLDDDDEFDEDFDEDDEDFEDEFDGTVPGSAQDAIKLLEEIAKLLSPEQKQQVKNAMDAGEDMFTALDRVIMGSGPKPRAVAKRGKGTKTKPPGQGSLF